MQTKNQRTLKAVRKKKNSHPEKKNHGFTANVNSARRKHEFTHREKRKETPQKH